MRKIGLILFGVIGLWCVAGAQNLTMGEKAPEIKVTEWLTSKKAQSGQASLIEFFYSASEPCVKRLAVLDGYANTYSQLNVVVVAKDSREKMNAVLGGKEYAFAILLDTEGKTFNAFDVKFVPFCVLLDSKGRVSWFGNSTKLTKNEIDAALK